jgi:capsular exopolysaccharide synthesis family protein
MSRIDQALRQAAAAAPQQRPEDAGVDARPIAVDPAVLDRFAIEAPPKLPIANLPQPPVASEPSFESGAGTFIAPPALASRLVAGRDISPLIVEQYRRLAAVLHELQAQQGLKTVMVTSTVPREGKTLTISNLALTLSESFRQRVLVIDVDWRRPSLHDVFGVSNGVGLSDVVAAGKGPLHAVQVSRNLSLLTAGRRLSSPLAMLTSDRMRALVDEAASQFDWVLLDTPPVGVLPDAQLVARLSQGVLFVIAAGMTSYALIQRALSELGPERIVGTVLNRVEQRYVHDDSYAGYYGASAAVDARLR